jgi:aspartyl-tRNA(Asn)/glutamyl-tRNA(Gln) amidotransferase subunit A
LVESAIETAERDEPSIRAWVTLLPDQAIRAAKASERRIRRGSGIGPLEGIPFGAKDVFFTSGILTTAGSRYMADFVPTQDAAVISRLRGAGAILLGKTTTTEFAFGDPPSTRNPWHRGHTPGGSSSGSAAAVAASMATFSLGTQTGGSLLRPAAYCGLVALKPTFGAVSRAGVLPVSWTLDHVGAITRTVADSALVLGVLTDRMPAMRPSAPAPAVFRYEQFLGRSITGAVVGIPDRFFLSQAEAPVIDSFWRAAHVFESLGVRLRKIVLPPSFEAAQSLLSILSFSEGAAAHFRAYRHGWQYMGPRLQRNIEAGLLVSPGLYLRSQALLRRYRVEMLDCLRTVNAIATPTAPSLAPSGLRSIGTSIFNFPFTAAGVPAITFPIGLEGPHSLPVGMQLAASPWAEGRLLALGDAYQSSTEWHRTLASRPKRSS